MSWRISGLAVVIAGVVSVACDSYDLSDPQPLCDSSGSEDEGGCGADSGDGDGDGDGDLGGSNQGDGDGDLGAGGLSSGGLGGMPIDPERPVERSKSFCPGHGMSPECQDENFYYQYETFVGCGLRYVRKQDDLLEEEAYFVDLKTEEVVYRSYFTEDKLCLVAVDETGGPPTCDEFVREACGYLD